MNINKVIGIISYLPDKVDIRNNRKEKLFKLIEKCNYLFNLPIIIIAQNYSEEDITYFKNNYSNLIIYTYLDKLGITGARKQLRKIFLNSNYDYLIMLDDDVKLEGNSGEKYLNQIDSNPNCFIENNKSRLQLFAISKFMFSKLDFDDINPENEEGFEDRIFFYTLCKKFPEYHKKFNQTGITEHAIASKDYYSTWYTNQDLKIMLDKTEKILNDSAKLNCKKE